MAHQSDPGGFDSADLPRGMADMELMRRIIDQTVGFVGLLAPDGTLTEANAPALEAGGVSRDEVIGKKFWECYWWSHDTAGMASSFPPRARSGGAARRAGRGGAL